ncbi:MAG: hypothetical protein HN919_19265 [Verrucomicrobia bacterium]|nr:hypothetical protein [Verrucomicrobiota bacterium]
MSRFRPNSLLFTAALALLAAGCRTPSKQAPGLACTALAPQLKLSQSFVARTDCLRSARIVLKTLNPLSARSDPVMLAIVDRQERIVGHVIKQVPMGYRGGVEFVFAGSGIELTTGNTYFLRVKGSSRLPFGWYQRHDFYPHGSVYEQGIAIRGLDWCFSLRWRASPLVTPLVASL